MKPYGYQRGELTSPVMHNLRRSAEQRDQRRLDLCAHHRARAEAKAEVQSQLADTDDGTVDYSACDVCTDGMRGNFGLCAACEYDVAL